MSGGESFIKRLRRRLKRQLSWALFITSKGAKSFLKVVYLIGKSKSQLGQDLFVLFSTNFKNQGYFVEFGATDGKSLSNTYLLEKKFGWNGILAEPGLNWIKRLKKNRNVEIDARCVYSRTGESVMFREVKKGEFSTITDFANSDHHSKKRINSIEYHVETISLEDLLDLHNAPREIDYISIDTEGSEYEIIKGFDFNSYEVQIFTIEHNYGENRELINTIMLKNGYRRMSESLSLWDDWYIKVNTH
jgi:FkbM family methyltransferase